MRVPRVFRRQNAGNIRCTIAMIATSAVMITGLGAMPASAETAAGLVQFEDQTQDPAVINKQMQDEAQKAAKAAVWTPGTIPAEPADADKPAPELPQWKVPNPDRKLGQAVSTQRVPAGTPVGAPGLGALPYMSFEDISLSDDTVARVNLANGNLLLTANDGTSSAAGIGVRADRYYNGLSSSAGALGGGWSSVMSNVDFGLSVNSGETEATFVGPTGFSAKYTKNSAGAWVAPAGFNASLSKGQFTWKLKYNKSGEAYDFDVTTKQLTYHTDRNGIGLTNDWTTSATTYTVKDTSGRFTRVNHTTGSDPKITSIVDSANRTTTYTRNGSGQLTKIDKPGGAVTTMTYDTTGRLATMTVPSAPGTTTITFGYSTAHKVTKITQKSTSPTYGNKADVVTNFAYNSGNTVVTNPNGKASTYAYDNQGRVTSTKDPLNRTRSQSWTANSDVQTSTDALGSGSTPGNETKNSYDGLNNATKTELPTGAAASAVYSAGAGCASSGGDTFQVKCSTDASGNTASYDYDTAGNPTKKKDTTAGGTGAVEFERVYDNWDSTICGGAPGQVCSAKDGNGNITRYAYDGMYNLAKVTPPAPQGATTYTYDALSRVTSVTDPRGKVTKYAYDVRDRQTLITFANGSTLAKTYYPNGLVQYDSDSFAGTKQFEYDTLGRTTSQIGALAGLNQKYTYDAAGNILTFEDTSGITTNTYNAANELTSQREPGGVCPTSGNPAANSGCTLFEYNGNGVETRRVFPAGAQMVTTLDKAGRTTQVQAKNAAGGVTADVAYSFAKDGVDTLDIQTRTSGKEEGIPAGAVTAYQYDSQSRLTVAEEKAGGNTNAMWAYAYDAAGNRTSQNRSGNTGGTQDTSIDYGYNAANQLTSTSADTTQWVYDAAGNQVKNGMTGVVATYGDRGQVQSIGATNFAAFGEGNTDTQSATGGRSFSNSILGLSRQTNTSASLVQNYSRTPSGEAVGFRISSSHYYVTDLLGSVIGMFSGAGIWEGGYSYTPYGEERATSSNSAVALNSLRYIGGYQESTNLYKMGARYYDASLGRFTQMDPSGQEPQPYAYAACNPVGNIDPSGLSCAGAVAGFISAAGLLLITAGFALTTPVGAIATAITAGGLLLEGAGVWATWQEVKEECDL
ncbi:MAG: type IV secretion protein Rhs [Clavibacter sp.]|uniref:Sortase-processed secreted protein n=2 Tax=Microbacteriaceae TaxID=85023 RepID=B0RHA1_CLASE|nr:type IV secretion protein Rhs [Clavibacter sp.]OQJ48631.1 type IV secretion protein Rhs [Clavibacter sepedonicus]OQJ54175.1 type IV secretion protein Rhs [Clavibacter sepedonicus]CAQ00159.1 putative sortase-processed secreted protein [Clavibacter sepedonicus]